MPITNIKHLLFKSVFLKYLLYRITNIKFRLGVFVKQNKKEYYRSNSELKERAASFYKELNKDNLIKIKKIYLKSCNQKIDKYAAALGYLSKRNLIGSQFIFDKEDRKLQNNLEAEFKKRLSFNLLLNKSVFNDFLYEGDIDFLNMVNDFGLKQIPGKKIKTAIDCGAYIGDSSYTIFKLFNARKILSLEPNKNNFKLLKTNIALNNLDSIITPIPCGVGKNKTTVYLTNEGANSRIIEKKANHLLIKIVTIDSLVKKYKLEKVDLIKMDIEGFEREALLGAKETIVKFKPTIIAAVYHKPHDIWQLPRTIKKICPKYKFKFVSLNPFYPLEEKYLIAQ